MDDTFNEWDDLLHPALQEQFLPAKRMCVRVRISSSADGCRTVRCPLTNIDMMSLCPPVSSDWTIVVHPESSSSSCLRSCSTRTMVCLSTRLTTPTLFK